LLMNVLTVRIVEAGTMTFALVVECAVVDTGKIDSLENVGF